jgi:hypothetical protein
MSAEAGGAIAFLMLFGAVLAVGGLIISAIRVTRTPPRNKRRADVLPSPSKHCDRRWQLVEK